MDGMARERRREAAGKEVWEPSAAVNHGSPTNPGFLKHFFLFFIVLANIDTCLFQDVGTEGVALYVKYVYVNCTF